MKIGVAVCVLLGLGPSTALAGDIAPGSLRVHRMGDDIELTWGAGSGPYAIFSGNAPPLLARPANYVTTTASLGWVDAAGALDTMPRFYLVGEALECLDHPDCDDGDPCNGIERCNFSLGVCGAAPLLPRSPVDRPDDLEGPQIHLTYVLPSDGTDEELDINGQLDAEVRVAQAWLAGEVGDCMRFDTYQGSFDVTFARLARTNEEIRTDPAYVDQSVRLEFESLGLDDPEKLYAVYYGGTTDSDGCGGAAGLGGPAMLFLVERVAPGEPLTPCPYFAFVSGPSDVVRGPSGVRWAGVMMHENFHSLGVVPSCAPDHDDAHPGHLETISSDIMAFNGTGHDVYTLDAPRTQYYAHGDPGCLDLSHSAVWQAASPAPDAIPGKTHYVDPVELPCSEEPSTTSVGGGVAATIRFVNASSRTVQFYWIDFSGDRQPSALLSPWSDSCCGGTLEFHVFVATDATTGDCLGLFEMVPGDNRIVIAD